MTNELGGYTREALLEQIREYVRLNPPTQADQDEHAISFVLGNLNASTNHQTTREVVEAQYYKLRREEALQRIAELEAQFTDHTTAVGAFLSEMYATMIDPLDEGERKVAETCQALLEAARSQRDELNTLQGNKRHLDAIAEALGLRECRRPNCPGSLMCDEEECWLTKPTDYQPDKLAGMVRELRGERDRWKRGLEGIE